MIPSNPKTINVTVPDPEAIIRLNWLIWFAIYEPPNLDILAYATCIVLISIWGGTKHH